MAEHQDRDQDQDCHQDRIQDQDQEKTTMVENDADIAHSTGDQPSYPEAIREVLNHNINIAIQNATTAQLTTTSELPTQPDVHPMFTIRQRPVDFTFEWEDRSWLTPSSGSKALRICPSTHLSFPQSTVGAPQLAHWRVNYSTKDEAALTRFGVTSIAQPQEEALGIREMAKLDYSGIPTNSSGPTITFQPHENEIIRLGASNVDKTVRRMVVTKDMFDSARYSTSLPANLDRLTVMWTFRHIQGYADGRLLGNRQRELEAALREIKKQRNSHESSLTPPPPATGSSSKTPSKTSAWTPYPTQQLVDANTGRILATYIRSAPLSKTAGTLTIFPKILTIYPERYEDLSAELIEGIVIVTAAMVEMQQRNGGFLSGLREARAESTRWVEEAPHALRSDS